MVRSSWMAAGIAVPFCHIPWRSRKPGGCYTFAAEEIVEFQKRGNGSTC